MFKCVFDWIVCYVCWLCVVAVLVSCSLHSPLSLSLSSHWCALMKAHFYYSHSPILVLMVDGVLLLLLLLLLLLSTFLFIHFTYGIFFLFRLRSFFYSWLIFHMVWVWVHEDPKANLLYDQKKIFKITDIYPRIWLWSRREFFSLNIILNFLGLHGSCGDFKMWKSLQLRPKFNRHIHSIWSFQAFSTSHRNTHQVKIKSQQPHHGWDFAKNFRIFKAKKVMIRSNCV